MYFNDLSVAHASSLYRKAGITTIYHEPVVSSVLLYSNKHLSEPRFKTILRHIYSEGVVMNGLSPSIWTYLPVRQTCAPVPVQRLYPNPGA